MMANILEEIVANKRVEVSKRKKEKSVSTLEAGPSFARTCYSLMNFLLREDKNGIIAEFKRQSPSKGILNSTATVGDVTLSYAQNGASGLSVLTDTCYFGGTVDDLQAARALNAVPILRKDFIIDEYQILEAKSVGADVILLIAECLTKKEVAQLAGFAKSLGLEVLLEIHSGAQLDKLSASVDLVGVNNRDLTTFEVDINRSFELAEKIPDDFLKIAESGISRPATIAELKKAGFHGFLIGENFMKHSQPGEAFASFVQQLNQLLKKV